MQNDKLINAIERALQKKLNYAYMTCSYLPEISEIAEEIAAAIAPLVEAGELNDSQYTDDFLKWREKYFDRKTQVKHFRSKHNGEFRDIKQLERQYERAYNCNSKK